MRGILFSALLFASCGAYRCHAGSCPDGCCDARDRCQPGITAYACGHSGSTCAVCVTGQVCAGTSRRYCDTAPTCP